MSFLLLFFGYFCFLVFFFKEKENPTVLRMTFNNLLTYNRLWLYFSPSKTVTGAVSARLFSSVLWVWLASSSAKDHVSAWPSGWICSWVSREGTQRKTWGPAKVDLCPCLEVCWVCEALGRVCTAHGAVKGASRSSWHLAYATQESHPDWTEQDTQRKEPGATSTGHIMPMEHRGEVTRVLRTPEDATFKTSPFLLRNCSSKLSSVAINSIIGMLIIPQSMSQPK